MTRRGFLRKAAAAGAALSLPHLVPSSALGSTRSSAASERIVMGCIGVGGQGTYNMSAFMENPDVQVVAVCDVDKGFEKNAGGMVGLMPAKRAVEEYYAGKNGKGAYSGCAAYEDFRELLARDDIDAVTICTPDHWHGLIAVAAAQAGKDIYCEKPLTNTITEGRAVCDAVKKHGRVLQTGSHERSNDSVRFACELVRNGRIGRLHTIGVNMPNSDAHHRMIMQSTDAKPVTDVPEHFNYDFWLGPTPKIAYIKERTHFWWRFVLDYGGGEMTDRGAHIIDLGQLANNTDDTGPVELSASGRAPADGIYNAFMEYDFECTYANGVRLIGKSIGPRGLKLEGTDGWIFIHIHGGRLEADPPSLLKETVGPNEIHLGRSPEHHRNFLDAVKARIDPVAPAEVGHRTGTICHLLNIAMLTDSKLVWDPHREQITNNAEANRMLARPMRNPWQL